MTERRREMRQRVIYGGAIAFDNHRSTVECAVRDFSPNGARVTFAGNVTIPDHFCLVLRHAFLRCPDSGRGLGCLCQSR